MKDYMNVECPRCGAMVPVYTWPVSINISWDAPGVMRVPFHDGLAEHECKP